MERNLSCFDNAHTFCNKLLHSDLIPANCEHFPEVAADPGAGTRTRRPSEPAALGLRHSGKLLHLFAFFVSKCNPCSVVDWPHSTLYLGSLRRPLSTYLKSVLLLHAPHLVLLEGLLVVG